MKNPCIWIREQAFSYDELSRLSEAPATLSSYERDVCDIARAWLSEKDTFWVRSSGTTGMPKPHALGRAQMQAAIKTTESYFSVPKALPTLLVLSVHHVAGLMALARALETRRSVCVLHPSAKPLSDFNPKKVRYGSISLTPMQVEYLRRQGLLNKLNAFHTLLVGGASLSQACEQALQKLRVKSYHTFGMTETCALFAARTLHLRESLYTCLPGVQLSLDAQECLVIRGAMTDWKKVSTQDEVELVEGGRQFRWLRRRDDVINSGGVKISLSWVEQKILEIFPDLSNFCCVAREDELLGQQLVWVIEGKAWPEARQSTCLSVLKERLPQYYAPKQVAFLDSLPTTDSGKADRQCVSSRLQGRREFD